MDIQITAKKHPNFRQLESFYTQRLMDKFGPFPFLKRINVNVHLNEKKERLVDLTLYPEKGKTIFASGEGATENNALFDAMYKAKRQVEKYQQTHYKSFNKNKAQ